MTYKAMCFDMDGVLVNSEPGHMRAFKECLARYEVNLSDEDYRLYFAGKTDELGFKNLFAARGLKLNLLELMDAKAKLYSETAGGSLAYYSGTIEYIRLLPADIPLALVTGSLKNEAEIVLNALNLADRFSVIVAAEDITHGKPNPEGYLLAAQRLGFAPNECLAIEDSPSGVQAAKQAGMYCLALTTTHNAAQLQLADRIEPTMPAGFHLK